MNVSGTVSCGAIYVLCSVHEGLNLVQFLTDGLKRFLHIMSC